MQPNPARPKATLTIVTIICLTVVAVASLGAWLYVEQQKLAQRDRELKQQQEIIKYEQGQVNDRAEASRVCKEPVTSSDSLNEQLKRVSLGC